MIADYPNLPGDATQTAGVAAGGHTELDVIGGAVYWLTADQPFHIKQSAAGTAAALTDFGPIGANTLIRARVAKDSKKLSVFNAGAAAMRVSIALDKF